MKSSIRDFQRGRTILHCDMNNFYASVECMNDPSLRDRPVAVCGSVEMRHGIVLAKNYLAKAYGVKTGDVIWKAKHKCPDLVVVEPHYDQYMKFSRLARDIYERYTDRIEPFGMDECWLDLSDSVIPADGKKTADEIRSIVKFELGLTISVGVSFNKVFAKLGSDMRKPDATTCIPYKSFKKIVWPLPVSDLLGVGRSTGDILSFYGFETIGDLAQAPERFLTDKVGKNGLMLKAFANGEDTSSVKRSDYISPVKSVGHGVTGREDLRNNEDVWKLMLELVQEVGHRLRQHGKLAGGVSVGVRDCKLRCCEFQCRLPLPTHSPMYLARAAYSLFTRRYGWDLPIRSLTVRAIDLIEDTSDIQTDIFTDPVYIDKMEKLDLSIENLRERFGDGIVKNAVLLGDTKMPEDRELQIVMPAGAFM